MGGNHSIGIPDAMKVLLCIVFLGLALGATSAQKSKGRSSYHGPVPLLTPTERNAQIAELLTLVRKIEVKVARYMRIGKENVARLERVMNAVNPRKRRCLALEVIRPAPIPSEPLPEIPIPPLEGEPYNLNQISARIHQLEAKIGKLEDLTKRYTKVGKSNIVTLHKFAEAARKSVCGADHYSRCPVGYIYSPSSGSCFHELVGRFKTFAHAQEKCHRRGGHLPRIPSQEVNDAIQGLLQDGVRSPAAEDQVHSLWIGLQKNEEGHWQWVHPENSPVDLGEPNAYSNFNSQEEHDGKTCAFICLMSHKWLKAPCDIKARIICEHPKNPEPTTASSAQSD